jgi:hypothetical protein
MARPTLRPLALLLSLSLAACDDSVPAPVADAAVDAPAVDAASVDRPAADATSTDAALDAIADATADAAVDVGTTDRPAADAADASTPGDGGTWSGSDEILGTLRGTCGTIRAMLHSPSPSLVRNDLLFVSTEHYTRDALSPGGQTLYDTMNAGGSSTESEALS